MFEIASAIIIAGIVLFLLFIAFVCIINSL